MRTLLAFTEQIGDTPGNYSSVNIPLCPACNCECFPASCLSICKYCPIISLKRCVYNL